MFAQEMLTLTHPNACSYVFFCHVQKDNEIDITNETYVLNLDQPATWVICMYVFILHGLYNWCARLCLGLCAYEPKYVYIHRAVTLHWACVGMHTNVTHMLCGYTNNITQRTLRTHTLIILPTTHLTTLLLHSGSCKPKVGSGPRADGNALTLLLNIHSQYTQHTLTTLLLHTGSRGRGFAAPWGPMEAHGRDTEWERNPHIRRTRCQQQAVRRRMDLWCHFRCVCGVSESACMCK